LGGKGSVEGAAAGSTPGAPSCPAAAATVVAAKSAVPNANRLNRRDIMLALYSAGALESTGFAMLSGSDKGVSVLRRMA
jgi:hypothetical protein